MADTTARCDLPNSLPRCLDGEGLQQRAHCEQGGVPHIDIRLDGTKEVLGLWIAQMEGAKFWLSVHRTLDH